MKTIRIDTLGNQIIDKNPDGTDYPKVDALMTVDGQTLNIGIETRGSTSLTFDKRSFGIEVRDDKGEDLNFALLGFPKESDFVFYGYYSDKTGIRNALAMKMAQRSGHYASRTKYFELIINKEYRGVYVLMEKPKRDDNRVAIHKLGKKDIKGDDVTGGYIFEVNKKKIGDADGWISGFNPSSHSSSKTEYMYLYPKAKKIGVEQKSYIKKFMDKVEVELNNGDLSSIDIDHAVDYFLLTEYTRNQDGYAPSLYLYKDKNSANSKLKIGVAWDFNMAMGNNLVNNPKFEGTDMWVVDILRNPEHMAYYWKKASTLPPFWVFKIWDNPKFQKKFKARWNELKADKWLRKSILDWVDQFVAEIGGAQKRDNEKWDTIGKYVWANQYVGKTYEKEIEYLKSWLTDRRDWMSKAIGSDVVKPDPKPDPKPIDKSAPEIVLEGNMLRVIAPIADKTYNWQCSLKKPNPYFDAGVQLPVPIDYRVDGAEFWCWTEIDGERTDDSVRVVYKGIIVEPVDNAKAIAEIKDELKNIESYALESFGIIHAKLNVIK